MNAKKAKELRRAAAAVFVEKLEDAVIYAQRYGIDPNSVLRDVPPPRQIYQRAKRKIKRGVT